MIVGGSGRILASLLSALCIGGALADDRGLEFFEKRIRPLLVENCYQCHSEKKQESGLALNSAAAIQKGGDRGAPLIENDPDNSLLIRAVQYADDDLKMPPRGKLKDEQIADLIAWVKAGAVIPRDETASQTVRPSSDFNLEQRAQHWAYQPVRPQLTPTIHHAAFSIHNSIDAFILAKLVDKELTPSPEASRRTLIRRLTFDLTGLPPTPFEIQAYLSDENPDAYERLVDRLLASPRYGERFGRHWLDVVRYSESLGFEFDYDLHNAWRYRDYVIRAFNSDLPYDQFVIEHLAGDLVPQPRRHSIDETNESILATGFWWMHEGKQTPVDIRQDQADRIDNQLDVLGKAFLGQTIACARCHDHKFDAISTCDYYALAGYLRSSRYQQAFVDAPELMAKKVTELDRQRKLIQRECASRIAERWIAELQDAEKYLTAAVRAREFANDEAKIRKFAEGQGLDAARLQKWAKAMGDESIANLDHPLAALSPFVKPNRAAESSENRDATSLSQRARERSTGPPSLFRFESDFAGSFMAGNAFGDAPQQAGQIVIGKDQQRPISRLTPGGADSGDLSPRLQGDLRSASFTIDKKFVHVLVAGRGGKVNLVIDGYTLIMNPMYGKLSVAPANDRLTWRTIPVDRWVGHRAFLEAVDSTIPMHGLNPPPSSARVPETTDGYVVIREAVLSDDPEPPAVASLVWQRILNTTDGRELPSVASDYQREMVGTIQRWRDSKWDSVRQRDDDVGLINWLLENGLLDAATTADSAVGGDEFVESMLAEYRTLEAAFHKPNRAPAIADGTGEDEFVFLRGNWRTPGERAMRGAPEVLRLTDIANEDGHSAYSESGRLELAHQLVDPTNPLLPRVIVNRLWQHHFGEGLVRTPDDFGRMGQAPTHPELLDSLSADLIKSEWSLKTMTRRMVTSATYRQASTASFLNPDPRTLNPTADPENRLLWHMPARRLEAEAIRDSVLAVSGRLSDQQSGPSVLPHITSHMEGRGKPQSGPLDGEGRRSIYLNARRNFLTPMLLAFDYPVTFTPIGRRGTSAIPAQALTLMNDPFVLAEAQRWAEKTRPESGSSAEQRIATLYETAFARPPTADELTDAIDFLQTQSLRHATGSDDIRVWTDFCHVLINVKEFIFIP
jgi:hypothetical protein